MFKCFKAVLIVTILLCGVHKATAQTNLLYKGKGERAAIKEKRDAIGSNPFKKAARVELLQYSNRMQWWYKLYPNGNQLVVNDTLTIPANYITARTTLTPQVAEKWNKLLYKDHLCEEQLTAGCYEPRHLLVFYAANQRVLGCIELCVSCAGGYVSNGLRTVVSCPERTASINHLLQTTLTD